ncbi:M15 family metallopeptidase [Streptomyces sp. NPDC007355]|uniref:M15 family metallopeptidase n=1 Tax=Streptomyces sp. NPDC007355 TaxID=3364778 RepID=UPI0036B13795
MARKHKRPEAKRKRPVVSLLGTVVVGAVAILGGSVLQAGLSSAFPKSVVSPGVSSAVHRLAAGVSVTVTGPHLLVSEQTGTLQIAVSVPRAEIAGSRVDWQSRPAGASAWRTDQTLQVDSAGRASVKVSPWKGTEYRAVVRRSHTVSDRVSTPFRVDTRPAGEAVVSPQGAAEPRFGAPADPARRPRAVGSGAHAIVSPVPDPVWERMAGVSFGEGCPVGRENLRYVQVNYWGFDGYRYRGEIVVHASIARQTAAVFTDLYRLKYPIRQMRLADDFGKDPLKGANDYSAMDADNTSGFNCRYVDGKEAQQVLSPHAWGMAIDINTWENPFHARTGVFPDSSYLDRDLLHRAVLDDPESPAVHAFENRGLQWGGRWEEKDYHHFETPPANRPEGKRTGP